MRRRIRAIVVDDSRIAAKLLAVELQAIGFEARSSSSVDEAGAIASEFEPDLILADLNMPNVRETEVCPRLRQAMGNRRALLWIFSGLAEDELSKRTIELGADGHLSKTLTHEEMRRRLTELLRQLEEKRDFEMTSHRGH